MKGRQQKRKERPTCAGGAGWGRRNGGRRRGWRVLGEVMSWRGRESGLLERGEAFGSRGRGGADVVIWLLESEGEATRAWISQWKDEYI
jgi:hypothetical protein